MPLARWPFSRRCVLFSLSAMLVACGSVSPPPVSTPVEPASLQPGVEKFYIALGEGVMLNYQIERKMSNLDRKSCYFFIRGTLSNQSSRTLSKASVLDFVAMRQGQQTYRDISHPVASVAPGGQAMFGLIASPVYRTGCPVFDYIDVNLRPSFLD